MTGDGGVTGWLRKAGGKLAALLELIRFEHTVFALPFAYLATFMASGGRPDPATLGWITLAMVAGRSAAMAINRLVDREIDRRNPRTAGRPLQRGAVRVPEAVFFTALSLAGLFYAAWRLNPLAFKLAPLVPVAFVIYATSKRWTWLAHAFLGLAQALGPLGAWIGVTGRFEWCGVLLGAATGLWVAGFDVLYALQDVEFDRREGLHSVPARFGVRPALAAARLGHGLTLLLFLAVSAVHPVGSFYVAAVALMGLLLAYEHSLVSPDDLSRLDVAFFNVNGVISVGFFLVSVIDAVR